MIWRVYTSWKDSVIELINIHHLTELPFLLVKHLSSTLSAHFKYKHLILC